jgi:hypothetical protein
MMARASGHLPQCVQYIVKSRDICVAQNESFGFTEHWKYLLRKAVSVWIRWFPIKQMGYSLLGLKLAETFRAFNKRINSF